MSNTATKVTGKDLLPIIKKALPANISLVDVTDDFSYKDVFVYDCKISAKNMHVGIIDSQGDVKYIELEDMILIDDEAALIIGSITQKIEDEIRLSLGIDNVSVDYEPYTFLDYRYDIMFVLLVDFSDEDRRDLRIKRKKIAYVQQTGKSKYLN